MIHDNFKKFKIIIVKAIYGTKYKYINVTSIVKNNFLKNNILYISKRQNLNDLFSDPCKFIQKKIIIDLLINNIPINICENEMNSRLVNDILIDMNVFKHNYNLKKITKFNDINENILNNILDKFILNKDYNNSKLIYVNHHYPDSKHTNHYNEKYSNYKPFVCFNDEIINEKIPKKIHKIFLNATKDKIPNEFYDKAINTWKSHYPDFELIIYDINDAKTYILENYGLDFLYVYNLLIPFAFKADFLRLCILYNEGGIYSDLKQVCNYRLNINLNLINFIHSEETYVSWIEKSLDFNPVQNCFIACCKKHPYIKCYIDLLIQNVLNNKYGIACTDVTGPIVFGRVINVVKKNWKYVNEFKELKLYFNRFDDNSFFINYNIHSRVNSFVVHKYDNSAGADWSKLDLVNNHYCKLWADSNIFIKKNKKICDISMKEIDYLNNFILIINCSEIYLSDIINRYKYYQTFILINTKNNIDIVNITVNNNMKIINNKSIKTIEEFITKYIQNISILILYDNIIDFYKYFSNNNSIQIYSLKNFLLKNDYDFLITKKKKKQDKPFLHDIKPYAIYFPQFHEIIENNINFYSGFTDIKNLELFINKTNMVYETPSNNELNLNKLSEYNLTNTKIIQKQIDILSDYNLSGFAMYYYWFSRNDITNNHMIMEKCINIFFNNSIDMKNKKLFFIWANEDWSNNIAFGKTTSKHNSIINEYTEENMIKNIKNLIKYFNNNNYLKINNKPVFFIYHVFFMQENQLQLFHYLINKYCIHSGFNGIHLVFNSMNGYNINYKNFYMNLNYKNTNYEYKYYDNNLSSSVVDYYSYVHSHQHIKNHINTIFYDFDNRVRFFKPNNLNKSTQIINNDEIHKVIFSKKIVESYNKQNKEEIDNILLFNAWNEWGEKMTLEPSNENGYYNLNLLTDCLV